jgi:hypothetical protein
MTCELVDIIESQSDFSTNDGRYAPVWKPGSGIVFLCNGLVWLE